MSQKVAADSYTHVTVTGKHGIPTSGLKAVLVNVTMADAQQDGWLVAYPAGSSRPTASTVNYLAGEAISNTAIVKVTSWGKFLVYSRQGGTLIVDVQGWFDRLPEEN